MNRLASIICVTQDRPAFWPWLRWNFLRQTYRPLELVLVDSSVEENWRVLCALMEGNSPEDRKGGIAVRLVRLHAGTGVDVKYNAAVSEASGEVVHLWGDDDWQHPRRTELVMHAFAEGASPEAPDLVSWNRAWYFDLWTGRSMRYEGPPSPVASLAGVARPLARVASFDGSTRSDTRWMQAVVKRSRAFRLLDEEQEPPSIWLVHGANMSKERPYRWHRGDPVALFGSDWDATSRELERLRYRLGGRT